MDPASLTDGSIIPASDTGYLNNDAITYDTTPTLAGTGAEPGATVRVYSDLPAADTLFCTGIADGLGDWTCVASLLPVGTHTIYGLQTDLAGNESTSLGTGTMIIDTADATGSFSTAAFVTNNTNPD